MLPIERRASIELHGPQVAVEVDPVAGPAGAAQLRGLPDAAVRAGVQGVPAGEDGRVEIRMDHATGVDVARIGEAGAAVARGQDGDAPEYRVVGIAGIDRHDVVV